ncbi:MAG: hypothetical protein FP810_19020 [Desulfocapsa sp.]|nr:hypothetical protein [Desulfocapsa sp.]
MVALIVTGLAARLCILIIQKGTNPYDEAAHNYRPANTFRPTASGPLPDPKLITRLQQGRPAR